ncbi:MAG TPA: permease-like cell division protein FtsX [Bacillota bacterium]|nr:permease-like cell division protein FtsX [Clostridiaceae bacterium]HNR04629.1 permease-like cell division protein FtsX [Bacillota bacterium]HNT03983.1 permease-like cell division protein FtsX [Bacillota bacterium]HPX69772.1 permease-like cell division protein FtsX [Bacillota bacterium]HQA66085.1 permease-like cell division protein FtsX [Bacillota bacterium]
MKLRTGKFFIREGFRSLKRNSTMSAAAITSVIAALLVIGIFFIIVINIDYAATKLESQIEMMVYLEDGLSENIIDTMETEIRSINGVKSVEFISKDTALSNLEKNWGENSYLLEGLEGDNPLPDAFLITLSDPSDASGVALSVSSISNIEKVVYGKEELAKLLNATYVMRMSSVVIILILLFISIFIIANTIKLTLYARRREIGIMKYVGATDWFVRMPFIIEGIVVGMIGAVVSTVILGVGYYYCSGLVKNQMIGFMSISLIPFNQIIVSMVILLIIVGVVIGAVGSLISVRKFIKV